MSADHMPDPRELEETLLGDELRYTRKQIIELAQVPEEFADRVWGAMGFALLSDDAVAFTEGDLRAMSRIRRLLDAGLLDEEQLIRMARAAGQTMARLAEWQVDIFVGALTDPAEPVTPEAVRLIAGVADTYVAEIEPLILHTWRRQLAASGTRALALAGSQEGEISPSRVNLGVGFADLVSFTRLSRGLDEPSLARLVERFEETTADVIAENGGRLVKTLGDEVLFNAESPAVAAELALLLTQKIAADDEVPEVRVGLAYGPVLPLRGDVFGTTVNRAARLTSIARPGTVVIDSPLAAELDGSDRYELIRLVRRPLRGLGLVQPHVLRRAKESS